MQSNSIGLHGPSSGMGATRWQTGLTDAAVVAEGWDIGQLAGVDWVSTRAVAHLVMGLRARQRERGKGREGEIVAGGECSSGRLRRGPLCMVVTRMGGKRERVVKGRAGMMGYDGRPKYIYLSGRRDLETDRLTDRLAGWQATATQCDTMQSPLQCNAKKCRCPLRCWLGRFEVMF